MNKKLHIYTCVGIYGWKLQFGQSVVLQHMIGPLRFWASGLVSFEVVL